MPTVYLTVGPPGAGKTTFVSWHLVAQGRVGANYVLNPDGLLFDRDGYHWSPGRVARAWRQVRGDYQRLLETGRDLVLDATSVRRRDRRPYVEAALRAGYRVVAVWFDVPLPLLVERDGQREDHSKRVGAEVVRRFVDELEPPAAEERFDELWTVDAAGEIVEQR
jgi:predicted kinase